MLEACLGVQCTIELKQDGLLAKGQVLCDSQNLAPVGIPRSPSKIGCYPFSTAAGYHPFRVCRFLLSLSYSPKHPTWPWPIPSVHQTTYLGTLHRYFSYFLIVQVSMEVATNLLRQDIFLDQMTKFPLK